MVVAMQRPGAKQQPSDALGFSVKCPAVDASFENLFKRYGDSEARRTEKQLWSVQQKIAAIAYPLFELKVLVVADGSTETEELVDTAIDKWTAAFNFMTHLRRKNIIRVTHGRYEDLVDDPDNFSGRESGKLFGRKFTDVLVATITRDRILDEAKEVLGAMRRKRSRHLWDPYEEKK